MKKIVKLTESDLTRIVKRVIQEENQLQEGFSWKSLLPTIVIAASLNLSSCKSKEELKQKLPDIETKVEESIEKYNVFLKKYEDPHDRLPDHVEFLKVMSIKGPIKECNKCPNKYYITSKIDETNKGEHSNKYFIYLYEEDKNGQGKFIGSSDFYDSMEQAKYQLEYLIKNNRLDKYNSYSEYMDELDRVDLSLSTMKNEYSGEYDDLGISSNRYNQPSDYYKEIDQHFKDLKNLKLDVSDDLKQKNISEKEHKIITDGIDELLTQLEEFKYSIR